MNRIVAATNNKRFTSTILALAIEIGIVLLCLNSAQAQSTNHSRPKGSSNNLSTFAAPPPPSDVGAPHKRSHAGSRGCRKSNKQLSQPRRKSLTALVPKLKTSGTELAGGLTTTEHPTLLFYVPHNLTAEHSIEFVLKDRQDNYVYQNKFIGKETPSGIVSVKVPDRISLQAGRNYSWHFLIYCGDSSTPANYVNGSIQRVERPELENQLKVAQAEDKVVLYADRGIWYEALAELAKLRRTDPRNENFREDWLSLLRSIGLEHLGSEPFVSCCSENN